MYKFYRTYCNSKYCLFIGTCATIDDPKFQLDDICIASQSKHCMSGFVSTLEHVTREWESSNEIGRWFCDQRRENSSPSVVFGKVGKDDLDNTVDFISNDALQFCRSSENAYSKGARIQHTAILLVGVTYNLILLVMLLMNSECLYYWRVLVLLASGECLYYWRVVSACITGER